MNRLLHVFFNTDMRCNQVGLAAIAKMSGSDLKPGDMICFINKKRDRIKILAGIDEIDSQGVLGYYISPHGRIAMEAIQHIPRAFSGGSINYDAALRRALEEKIGAKNENYIIKPGTTLKPRVGIRSTPTSKRRTEERRTAS